jgi:apolipoprotein N-acyltransferase
MGDLAMVGTNGAGATVAVAEAPRRRFAVPLAVLSGLCLSAAFPSLEIAPLAWIGLVPLLLAIRGRSPLRAFGLGWITGTVFYLATCYWIVYTIGHYTALPRPVAAGVLFLMASTLGCYHGAFALGVAWFERRRLPSIWLAPALWVTLEWLRGWFFIGFPWAALGYSQYRFHDLVQMAEVTGVYGVSAVLVLFNMVVAAVLLARGQGARRNLPALATLTLLLVVLLGFGRWRVAELNALPAAGHLRVGLVQGNVEQDKKWDPAFQDETMRRYRELTLAAAHEHPALIVWPETAAPFFFQEAGPRRDEILALAREAGVPIVFGSPAFRQTASGRLQQLNRVYLVDASGREVDTYDKMQLVPFGEYVPFAGVLFFVSQVVTAVGQLGAGIVPTVFQIPESRFGALICYEGIFPALTRRFVDGGAQFLVNVTNDAWYGNTSAPYQHLAQAAFRTVENRVPMVRAANTGISAIIDADGQIRWESPLFEMLWHVDEIRWTGVGTFYTRYGDVFVWLCVLVTVAAIVLGVGRRGAGARPISARAP